MADGDENVDLSMPFSLTKIDAVAEKLGIEQQCVKSLAKMEEALVASSNEHGMDSDEVWEQVKAIASICNSLAMQYLNGDAFDVALDLLKRSEELTDPRRYATDDNERMKIRAVCYNNLGCVRRRQGKLKMALRALEKALNIEAVTEDVVNPSGTHLNVCVVLSQLGRHTLALEHAQAALLILQEELFASEEIDDRADRMGSLCIAFSNLAVEHEYLLQYSDALQSYGKADEIAKTYLAGTDLAKVIHKTFMEAEAKLSKKIKLPSSRPSSAASARGGKGKGKKRWTDPPPPSGRV